MVPAKSIEAPGAPRRNSLPEKDFRRLEAEALEVSAELVTEVRPGEGEIHRGLEKAQLVAGVVAPPLELQGVDRPLLPEGAQPVGELDLATRVRRGLREDRKEVGGEDVAADDGEIRRRIFGRGLLDQVQDLVDVAAERLRLDDAVAADLLARNAHDRDDGPVVPRVDLEELAHARGLGHDDVVAEEDSEGLAPDDGPRTEDGVAQAERLFLAHIGDGGQL